MNFDELFKTFMARPKWQRLFFAFTLALFMSCSMHVAEQAPDPTFAGSYAP